jgi:hypothetical protein
MPSNIIARPTFQTGPRDNLITVDVFTGTSGGIVNSIKALSQKYDVDLIGMLRAGAAVAQAIPVIEGIAHGKLLMNPQAAIARLLTASNTLVGALGGPINALNSTFSALSADVQAGIAAAGQVVGEVEVAIGGVVSSVVNGAIGDIQALGGLINQFAGGNGFLMVDVQALGGFAAGVINECARYGISGAFAQMTKNITDPRVLNAIIGSTLPNLISASDIGGLQALANVANVVGIGAINPRMLPQFTRAYVRIGSGSVQQATPYQDSQNWNDMMDCYDTAQPDWNVASRAGDDPSDPTLDITALQNGTEDFNAALSAGVYNNSASASPDDNTHFYALAPLYEDTDVNQQMKDAYPNSYIDPALRSTDQVIDPRQVQNDTTPAVDASTSETAYQPSTSVTNQIPVKRADGTINSAQKAKEMAMGYNSGALVFDDNEAPQNSTATNDSVADTPSPVTFSRNGKTYMTITGGQDRGTYQIEPNTTGQQAQANSINWGQGYWHSDEKYLYNPVDATTLQPVKN